MALINLPPGYEKLLVQLRLDRNMSQADLIRVTDKHGVGERTIKYLEIGERQRVREDTLKGYANALGLQLNELVVLIKQFEINKSYSKRGIYNFEEMLLITEKIDLLLIELIRSIGSTASKDSIALAHCNILESELNKYGLSLDTFIELLSDESHMAMLIDTLPEIVFSVEVGDHFDWITYSVGSKSIKINEPLLLWNCTCLTNEEKKSTDVCPIHKEKDNNIIESHFQDDFLYINWRGLKFLWRQGNELWPPSIDSFHYAITIDQLLDCHEEAESLIDIGSGTGFLGIFIQSISNSLKTIRFTDWLLTPLLFSSINWHLNFNNNTGTKPMLLLGINTKWINTDIDEPVDLVICNPPYLPIPEKWRAMSIESTVAGTELLEEVIKNAQIFSKKAFVQFSLIASVEAKTAALKGGKTLKKIGSSRLVPFRVPSALNTHDYLDWLCSERGVRQEPNKEFKYWHSIQAYEII